jgi:hypothetical protein
MRPSVQVVTFPSVVAVAIEVASGCSVVSAPRFPRSRATRAKPKHGRQSRAASAIADTRGIGHEPSLDVLPRAGERDPVRRTSRVQRPPRPRRPSRSRRARASRRERSPQTRLPQGPRSPRDPSRSGPNETRGDRVHEVHVQQVHRGHDLGEHVVRSARRRPPHRSLGPTREPRTAAAQPHARHARRTLRSGKTVRSPTGRSAFPRPRASPNHGRGDRGPARGRRPGLAAHAARSTRHRGS